MAHLLAAHKMTIFFKINCTWYAALTRLDARQMVELGVFLRDHIDPPFCGAMPCAVGIFKV